jgi:hypothetical protein
MEPVIPNYYTFTKIFKDIAIIYRETSLFTYQSGAGNPAV